MFEIDKTSPPDSSRQETKTSPPPTEQAQQSFRDRIIDVFDMQVNKGGDRRERFLLQTIQKHRDPKNTDMQAFDMQAFDDIVSSYREAPHQLLTHRDQFPEVPSEYIKQLINKNARNFDNEYDRNEILQNARKLSAKEQLSIALIFAARHSNSEYILGYYQHLDKLQTGSQLKGIVNLILRNPRNTSRNIAQYFGTLTLMRDEDRRDVALRIIQNSEKEAPKHDYHSYSREKNNGEAVLENLKALQLSKKSKCEIAAALKAKGISIDLSDNIWDIQTLEEAKSATVLLDPDLKEHFDEKEPTPKNIAITLIENNNKGHYTGSRLVRGSFEKFKQELTPQDITEIAIALVTQNASCLPSDSDSSPEYQIMATLRQEDLMAVASAAMESKYGPERVLDWKRFGELDPKDMQTLTLQTVEKKDADAICSRISKVPTQYHESIARACIRTEQLESLANYIELFQNLSPSCYKAIYQKCTENPEGKNVLFLLENIHLFELSPEEYLQVAELSKQENKYFDFVCGIAKRQDLDPTIKQKILEPVTNEDYIDLNSPEEQVQYFEITEKGCQENTYAGLEDWTYFIIKTPNHILYCISYADTHGIGGFDNKYKVFECENEEQARQGDTSVMKECASVEQSRNSEEMVNPTMIAKVREIFEKNEDKKEGFIDLSNWDPETTQLEAVTSSVGDYDGTYWTLLRIGENYFVSIDEWDSHSGATSLSGDGLFGNYLYRFDRQNDARRFIDSHTGLDVHNKNLCAYTWQDEGESGSRNSSMLRVIEEIKEKTPSQTIELSHEEQAEQGRLKQEQLAQQQAEQERLEKEQLAQQQAEQEHLEKEQLAQQQAEQERLEQEQLAQQQAEQEHLEKEQLAQQQAEQERLEQEQLAQQQAEQEHLEKEQLAQQQAEQERLEKEQLAQQQAEQEHLELHQKIDNITTQCEGMQIQGQAIPFRKILEQECDNDEKLREFSNGAYIEIETYVSLNTTDKPFDISINGMDGQSVDIFPLEGGFIEFFVVMEDNQFYTFMRYQEGELPQEKSTPQAQAEVPSFGTGLFAQLQETSKPKEKNAPETTTHPKDPRQKKQIPKKKRVAIDPLEGKNAEQLMKLFEENDTKIEKILKEHPDIDRMFEQLEALENKLKGIKQQIRDITEDQEINTSKQTKQKLQALRKEKKTTEEQKKTLSKECNKIRPIKEKLDNLRVRQTQIEERI